jgi:hypothetical protein
MTKASGGSQRRKAAKQRKQRGEKGLSGYMAKQNRPYSDTMPGPATRTRSTFDGFRVVESYIVPVAVKEGGDMRIMTPNNPRKPIARPKPSPNRPRPNR